MKKADIVRALIAASKRNGATEVTEELIAEVQAKCGFKRQLARAYLKWFTRVKVEDVVQQVQDYAADYSEMFAVAEDAGGEAVTEDAAVEILVDKLALRRARDAARKREKRAAEKAARAVEVAA